MGLNGLNMRINKEYFLPLVEDFCKAAEEIGSDGYPRHGLFIPYTFENYHSAQKKIFYMGRDTAGWIKFEEMIEDYKNGSLNEYLDKNSKVVTVQGKNENSSDTHSLKEGWNIDNKWDFWRYSQKLHLYITLGMTDIDITQLTDDEYQIIEEMGYGNLNSLEHDRTLQTLDYYGTDKKCWDVIQDKDKFNELRQASRRLDRIKHVLDAYRPDLIIIMNWEDRMDIFEGLEINEIKDFYIDKLRSVYEIPEYNTKVIWTNHPGARSISVYERLALIGDTARELLNVSK